MGKLKSNDGLDHWLYNLLQIQLFTKWKNKHNLFLAIRYSCISIDKNIVFCYQERFYSSSTSTPQLNILSSFSAITLSAHDNLHRFYIDFRAPLRKTLLCFLGPQVVFDRFSSEIASVSFTGNFKINIKFNWKIREWNRPVYTWKLKFIVFDVINTKYISNKRSDVKKIPRRVAKKKIRLITHYWLWCACMSSFLLFYSLCVLFFSGQEWKIFKLVLLI